MNKERAFLHVGYRNEIPKTTDKQNICADYTEKTPKEVSSLSRDFKGRLRKYVIWH